MIQIDQSKIWYQPNLDVFLNRWFSSYEAARKSLESEGGFLLPYERHFFVCESDVITAMGLEPDDPDWERIGRDCAQPSDVEAYERLCRKREQVVRKASTESLI
jgi:hypothetical protein